MRIMHVLAGDNFTEDMGYKDNFLAASNKEAGHDVIIVSNCRMWKDNKLVYAEPCDYIMENGVRLIRLPYKNFLFQPITERLRVLDGIEAVLDNFKPDVIRILNIHNLTIPIIVEYKKKNPKVVIYIDSHQDYGSSGLYTLSRRFFHKVIIKKMITDRMRYFEKVFYCQESVRVFLKQVYDIPDNMLEFFPMGGVIVDKDKQRTARGALQEQLPIGSNDIVLIHSGKMDKLKNTIEILEAFCELNPSRLKLLLVGQFYDDIKKEALELISSNKNIHFLGWKSAAELRELMAASDVYLQPGSASATIWQAICCGNLIVASPHINGYDYLVRNGGRFASSKAELLNVFSELGGMPHEEILNARDNSFKFAQEKLDYRVLASRLTQ